MLDLQVSWYLNIKNWLENFQNYYEYPSILIRSIFHHNTWAVENPFTFQDRWTVLENLHRYFP
jgi:hypothetical protein